MYIQGIPFEIQTPKHWNPICPSMTSPAACVIIVQQYSSATLLRFHSHKAVLDAHFKIVITSVFFFFPSNFITLKWRTLKFHTSWTVCLLLLRISHETFRINLVRINPHCSERTPHYFYNSHILVSNILLLILLDD